MASKNCEQVKALYRKRLEHGLCRRCGAPAIEIIYKWKGKIISSRMSIFCPNHNEKLLREALNQKDEVG